MNAVGIAIAGASCSGKTTLAHALCSELGATLVRIDDYYRPLDDLTYERRCEVNFDHPDAIDSERLIADFKTLLSGRPVLAPRYDFSRHTRFAQGEWVVPERFVVVEGLFSLCYPELVELCDVRVFVDAPEEVCLERRIVRDTLERGRTMEEVTRRFTTHVAPMFTRHVLPTRALASMSVRGDKDMGEALERMSAALARDASAA